ncbi:hypothetical protein Tco_1415786 [Tanacetum coccineum]
MSRCLDLVIVSNSYVIADMMVAHFEREIARDLHQPKVNMCQGFIDKVLIHIKKEQQQQSTTQEKIKTGNNPSKVSTSRSSKRLFSFERVSLKQKLSQQEAAMFMAAWLLEICAAGCYGVHVITAVNTGVDDKIRFMNRCCFEASLWAMRKA